MFGWSAMSDVEVPLVSAVISTCDRPASVVNAVKTVLGSTYPRLELIVVDQSRDDRTREVLRRFFGDGRFVYVPSGTRGLGRGLNIGISHARSEIVAITDDDCEVPRGWIGALVDAFSVDPRIGVIFGNVLAAEHDLHRGFIPAYASNEAFLARSIRDKHRIEGMGACMGLLRGAWHSLGGFDEAFGAGGEFRSSADLDLAIRALVAGIAVYETPSVSVTHNGLRSLDSMPELVSDYLFGTGACLAKQVKRGNWRIFEFLMHLGWRWAFQNPGVDFGARPPRSLRLRAFVKGFLIALRRPVNRLGLISPGVLGRTTSS
jgi:GT2 family glycosyltransferase